MAKKNMFESAEKISERRKKSLSAHSDRINSGINTLQNNSKAITPIPMKENPIKELSPLEANSEPNLNTIKNNDTNDFFSLKKIKKPVYIVRNYLIEKSVFDDIKKIASMKNISQSSLYVSLFKIGIEEELSNITTETCFTQNIGRTKKVNLNTKIPAEYDLAIEKHKIALEKAEPNKKFTKSEIVNYMLKLLIKRFPLD